MENNNLNLRPVPSLKTKILRFVGGTLFGLGLFLLFGHKTLVYGYESVQNYTWYSIGAGSVSFGILAMIFGGDFWRAFGRMIKN